MTALVRRTPAASDPRPLTWPIGPDATCPRCGHFYSLAPPDLPDAGLLMSSLEVAVFMATEDLRGLPWSRVSELARAAADDVAALGDVLQFGGKGCGRAFAALARGLAAVSFCPGGVRFGGAHWCARHPDSRATDGQYAPAGTVSP